MGKFIEVHRDGHPKLINLDHVTYVFNNMIAGVNDNLFFTDEDYQQLRKLISTAQGGIPMDRSGMY